MRSGRIGDRFRRPWLTRLIRGQRGQVLIEVLVALAIFGVVSVGFLTALCTGYQGIAFSHNRTTAQSLIRTTFEGVAVATFPVPDSVTTVLSYDVVVDANYINKDYTPSVNPTNMQMVTVTIKNHTTGRSIMTAQDLKTKPS